MTPTVSSPAGKQAQPSSGAGAPPGPGASWLDPADWRKVTYLHLQDLFPGRDVVELWSGPADARSAALLQARGARRVTVVAPQAATSGATTAMAGAPDRTGLPDASADLVLAIDLGSGPGLAPAAASGDPGVDLAGVVREARRVLRPDGILVLGLPSRDWPGAVHGASYYDVVDSCAAFARVQMIGLAPFAGATLVEYGVADPEPILDGTLVDRGERVEHYLAVAGPDRRGDFGYGVVQVPVASITRTPELVVRGAEDAGKGGPADRDAADASSLRASVARLEAELAARRAPEERLVASDAGDGLRRALSEALERHQGEMRAREVELAERDAYIRELESDGRQVNELRGQLARAEATRAEAETKERETRRLVAELEGKLLRGPTHGSNGVQASSSNELESLKQKLAAAETESWKQLKARSDAEAATAEMRDDMVRKLKDARKLATVELTRAMEEATKKAINLREELTRSESERKAVIEQLKALQATTQAAEDDAAHRRELARAREEGDASALAAKAAGARALSDAEAARLHAEAHARDVDERAAQLRGRLVSLERSLAEAERARDEARAELAGERARALSLSAAPDDATRGATEAAHAKATAEHAQERTRLRAEQDELERRLQATERDRPPRAEVERVRAESEQLQARLGELELELKRRDAVIERTASAAAHERARAERLIASERQALAERNDARARGAESHARLAAVEAERERVALALAGAEARVHKAENEIEERRERVRKLKRELAESERRAAVGLQRARALEAVRARVLALEVAVAGEARQLEGIEQALRAP